MRYARIYPWRRTRRSRAPSNGPDAFFVAQFSAGYTTNMFGFDLRQGQAKSSNGSPTEAALGSRRHPSLSHGAIDDVPLSPFAPWASKGSQVLAQRAWLNRRQPHWRTASSALRALVFCVEH